MSKETAALKAFSDPSITAKQIYASRQLVNNDQFKNYTDPNGRKQKYKSPERQASIAAADKARAPRRAEKRSKLRASTTQHKAPIKVHTRLHLDGGLWAGRLQAQGGVKLLAASDNPLDPRVGQVALQALQCLPQVGLCTWRQSRRCLPSLLSGSSRPSELDM